MSDADKQATPVQPTGLSRKRSLQTFYAHPQHAERIVVKQEPKDDAVGTSQAATSSSSHLLPPPSPLTLPSVRATPVRASTLDILDQAMAQSQQQRPATPSTPRSTSGTTSQTATTVVSAAERATQRSSVDERKFYADYYSQIQKWIALAHIGKNFIATAVNAETAVDLARSDETKSSHTNN